MASRQSAQACGGPGSWPSSATSRRCCTNGLPLQCPCYAVESDRHSDHLGGWVKTWLSWNAKSELYTKTQNKKTPNTASLIVFGFVLNIFPNVKICQEHRQITISSTFVFQFWNTCLQGWERGGAFAGLSWRLKETNRAHILTWTEGPWTTKLPWNMVFKLRPCPFFQFADSVLLSEKENWNLHGLEFWPLEDVKKAHFYPNPSY